jgi:hypothetical protein
LFTLTQLLDVTGDEAFRADFSMVREALAVLRLRQEPLLDPEALDRLGSFVDAVLASAPSWDVPERSTLCEQAAEVAELLAATGLGGIEHERLRLRSALLYELAGMPAMAAAVVRETDRPRFLTSFFKRSAGFGSLAAELDLDGDLATNGSHLLRLAACQDALELAEFQHRDREDVGTTSDALEEVARRFALDMTLTEVRAFESVVERRRQRATRVQVPEPLMPTLEDAGFPPELWEAQVQAISSGLLDPAFDAWAFAAPTGTGKTFLARLLILDALRRQPTAKVLYVVPSRALIYQVATDMRPALEQIDAEVTEVTPQLVALDTDESEELARSSVLVLTPEKADLLLRIGATFLSQVSLVVVDEAHHVESGTRGALLELYLARLRRLLGTRARYVFLSAVAPNLEDITGWIGTTSGGSTSEQRATRMKTGVYEVRKSGRTNEGWVKYADGTSVRVIPEKAQRAVAAGLVQLAHAVSEAGVVLVVVPGPGRAETIAQKIADALPADAQLPEEVSASTEILRLDRRLEREMYREVKLRQLIRRGVAYHHAGMPPRVRIALEDAIGAGYLRFVVATTTLAEGVNFPFSTVVVETLSIRQPTFEVGQRQSSHIITPRVFWNIAGRAGRPGRDHEGQVILFRPKLGDDDAALSPYLKPELREIAPVRSALADGLQQIAEAVADGAITTADLGRTVLPEHLPKRVKGVVNLIRVGLAHASATDESPVDAAEYFDSTLAARMLPETDQRFARRLLNQQQRVLTQFLETPTSPDVRLVAELGLSIETLSELREYFLTLPDWQLEANTHVLYGGRINKRQLPYTLSPVLKRMSELEGNRLGAFYTDLVTEWCSGHPFSSIRRQPRYKESKLEELIRIMYSRVQYMLPWGLYAADRFVEEEAARRSIPYNNELRSFAYLVDAGVPDLSALRLTTYGFERTDAARLADAYRREHDAYELVDIVGWVRGCAREEIYAIVRGPDRRRLDFDLNDLLERIGTP